MNQFLRPAAFAMLLCIAVLSGCASDTDNPAADTVSVSSAVSADDAASRPEKEGSGISYRVEDASVPSTASGSFTSPLSLGEWGSAAKLVTADGSYVNVPVRVISVRRGDDVTEEIKTISRETGRFFQDVDEKEEYLIAEYELKLDGFPVREGGTLCDITAFVTGETGEMIPLKNGGYYGVSAKMLDESTYWYEGTVHSQLAYPIPKEIKEHYLVLGEYGETQTVYRITADAA